MNLGCNMGLGGLYAVDASTPEAGTWLLIVSEPQHFFGRVDFALKGSVDISLPTLREDISKLGCKVRQCNNNPNYDRHPVLGDLMELFNPWDERSNPDGIKYRLTKVRVSKGELYMRPPTYDRNYASWGRYLDIKCKDHKHKNEFDLSIFLVNSYMYRFIDAMDQMLHFEDTPFLQWAKRFYINRWASKGRLKVRI